MRTLKTLRSAVLLGSLLLLSACGFQLRGTFNLPQEFRHLNVDGEEQNTLLIITLVETLRATGVKVDSAAPYTLYIVAQDTERERITVSETALTDDYLLINSASFVLQDRKGLPLLQPRSVMAQTTFTDDQRTPTVKAEEEASLRSELDTQLALQILRQLQSFDTGLLKPASPDTSNSTSEQMEP